MQPGMASYRYLCLALLLLLSGADANRKLLQDTQSAPINIIMFGHDDRLLENTFDVAYNKIIRGAQAKNPNGCYMPITWFINCCNGGQESSTCDYVQKAHELGHEISTHTMSHSRDTLNYTYEEWVYDIDGQRNWTIEQCGIPAEDVRGFRAPYYQTNELLGEVLDDLPWLEYDSSLGGERRINGVKTPFPPGPLNANVTGNSSADIAPFVPFCHESIASECNGWAGRSFWEVPAYAPVGDAGQRSDPVDLPDQNLTIVQRFQLDLQRKSGSGIPVGLNAHAPYLRNETHQVQLVQFLNWAFTTQPNTWGMTFQQYIAWREAGSPQDPTEVLADYVCDTGDGTPSPAPAVATFRDEEQSAPLIVVNP